VFIRSRISAVLFKAILRVLEATLHAKCSILYKLRLLGHINCHRLFSSSFKNNQQINRGYGKKINPRILNVHGKKSTFDQLANKNELQLIPLISVHVWSLHFMRFLRDLSGICNTG